MTTPSNETAPTRQHFQAQTSGSCSISDLASAQNTADLLGAVEVSVDFGMDTVTTQIIDGLVGIRNRGAALSVHAPFRDLNIASLNDGVFAAAKGDMLKAMDVAIQVGARVLNVHPGIHAYFPSARYPDMKARERDVFEALCTKGEQHGVLVAVENMINTNAHFEDSWTLDGLISLVEQVDSRVFGFCLDTGHAHQARHELPHAIRRLASVSSGAGRSGLALIHMHVHDNHGGPIDEHLPIGEGSIPWSPVTRAIVDVGYRGLVVFENKGVGPQGLALAGWRGLLPAAG